MTDDDATAAGRRGRAGRRARRRESASRRPPSHHRRRAASMGSERATRGLDALLEALDASASIRIQNEDARGAVRGRGLGKRARSVSASAVAEKRSVLRDVTNSGGVAPKTPAKGSMERGKGRGGTRRDAAPANEWKDEGRRPSEAEDMIAGTRVLVSDHADVMIDRVRQWLDLLGGDARGRLGALRRSEKRARAALEKFERKGVESDDVGMVHLREFEETLKVERELLLQTLQRLEGMRNTVEFEAAKLALGWLDRSNREMNDDDGTSDDENAKHSHSSSAYAFLCVALGAYAEDEAFAKVRIDASAATPSAVVDSARFFP